MRSTKVLVLAGLAALCRCSLLLDPSSLGGAAPPDAADSDEGGMIGAVDATNEDPGAGSADGASADVGRPSTANGGEAGPGQAVDAGVDTNRVDAADAGSSEAAVGGDAGASFDSGANPGPLDAATDAGGLGVGLVAFYPFDETTGTTSADVSGNGNTATLNGATFAKGVRGNAVTMNGNGQYVSLPTGIVSALTSFSICAWVNIRSSLLYARIFDFGTGGNAYMLLSPDGPGTRFGISIGGRAGEELVQGSMVATAKWQHVAVTLIGTTCTLYVNGARAAQNSITLTPVSLGSTTQNWLGKGQFAGDPYLDGQIDQFRIYDHELTAAEVQQLFLGVQ